MGATALLYGAAGNVAITFDISSLAASSTFVAGRECSQIDNTSLLYENAVICCDGILGHASTAPSIGQWIGLWAWASKVSLGTTPIDVLDGTDSAETLGHVAVLNSLVPVARMAVTVATAGLKYYFPPTDLVSLFGHMPKFWGLFLAHNHTGALAASQSGIWSYYGINKTLP